MVFACKRATFGAELQVSMGPRHDLAFCAFKTAWLASELLVSMGPSPHVCFLDSKHRLLVRNNKSLWDPVVLCVQNSVISTRVTSLYGIICGFCLQNSDFWTRIANLYGSQLSHAVLWLQCSPISTRTTCPYGSQPLSAVLRAKERLLEQNYKSVWDPDHTCRFVHARQGD